MKNQQEIGINPQSERMVTSRINYRGDPKKFVEQRTCLVVEQVGQLIKIENPMKLEESVLVSQEYFKDVVRKILALERANPSNEQLEMEQIIAAASLYEGKIYTARRHCENFAISESIGLPLKYGKQGFITDKGRFLTRQEAEVLGRSTGQVVGKLLGSLLNSEDMW